MFGENGKFNRKEEELKIREELMELRERVVKETADYKHEYHSAMEEKRIILARLDAEIKHKEGFSVATEIKHQFEMQVLRETYARSRDEKDDQIRTLQEQVKLLIEKLPEVNLKDLGITINQQDK